MGAGIDAAMAGIEHHHRSRIGLVDRFGLGRLAGSCRIGGLRHGAAGLEQPQAIEHLAHLQEDRLADALENDLNHYLTSVASEYYPDTDRMLFMLGFGINTVVY